MWDELSFAKRNEKIIYRSKEWTKNEEEKYNFGKKKQIKKCSDHRNNRH